MRHSGTDQLSDQLKKIPKTAWFIVLREGRWNVSFPAVVSIEARTRTSAGQAVNDFSEWAEKLLSDLRWRFGVEIPCRRAQVACLQNGGTVLVGGETVLRLSGGVVRLLENQGGAGVPVDKKRC